MTRTQDQLSEIVRLKKRAAENAYLLATQNLRQLDDQIERTQASIDAAGAEQETFSGAQLNAASSFVRRRIIDLKQLMSQRGFLVKEVEAARYRLQNIIVSETVLEQEQ